MTTVFICVNLLREAHITFVLRLTLKKLNVTIKPLNCFKNPVFVIGSFFVLTGL